MYPIDLKLMGATSRPLMSRISRNVKLAAIEMNAKGHGQHEITETLDISVGTLTRAKRNMKDFGDVEAPKRKRGPKSKMDMGMKEVNNLCVCMHIPWIF